MESFDLPTSSGNLL